MKRKSFKSRAINAVLTAIIRTLFGWVEEWNNDAFFFIVIGDKTCTDVAYYNTEKLAEDGAYAVTEQVETAAAFQDLATSFDILVGFRLDEDEDFRKKFELTMPEKDKQGWYSLENDETGHYARSKKGGKA
jgi:hypothetical protein